MTKLQLFLTTGHTYNRPGFKAAGEGSYGGGRRAGAHRGRRRARGGRKTGPDRANARRPRRERFAKRANAAPNRPQKGGLAVKTSILT